MKIEFVGSGNLATQLSLGLKDSGHSIIQVFSRSIENAKQLADKLGTEYTNDLQQIYPDAEMYFFSVKDDILGEVIQTFPATKGVLAHTAGAISMNVFKGRKERYGVFYPLQTFNKNRKIDFHQIPIFLEASDKEASTCLEEIAKSVSDHIQFLSSEKRQYLHLAAVFACNFTNHMYVLASNLLKDQGLEFDVLKPLISETTNKVMELSPQLAQTGPAIRFDENVIQKHISLLKEDSIQKLYIKLSESIHSHNLQNQSINKV